MDPIKFLTYSLFLLLISLFIGILFICIRLVLLKRRIKVIQNKKSELESKYGLKPLNNYQFDEARIKEWFKIQEMIVSQSDQLENLKTILPSNNLIFAFLAMDQMQIYTLKLLKLFSDFQMSITEAELISKQIASFLLDSETEHSEILLDLKRNISTGLIENYEPDELEMIGWKKLNFNSNQHEFFLKILNEYSEKIKFILEKRGVLDFTFLDS